MSMVFAIKTTGQFVIICRRWRRAIPVCRKSLFETEKMEEECFSGLRKKSGVSKKRFEEEFGPLKISTELLWLN